ncbi:MAG: hypothetical protein JNN07_12350 [Verrucomicrobiales bacterium]|nr:hypothetical protein [Verrucomicrobiales bacterium]
MTTEEFVRGFKVEKDRLLKSYISGSTETAVSAHIRSMGLNTEQSDTMREVLDQALTDTFYTILLGLDGCARIGDALQQGFKIQAEDGSEISSGGGAIEALAYEYFQT